MRLRHPPRLASHLMSLRAGTLLACVLWLLPTPPAAASARTSRPAGPALDVVVLVQGRPVARGLVVDGTVYLPVRAVAEALSLSVSWDRATRVVSLFSSPASQDTTASAPVPEPAPPPPAAPPAPPHTFNADLQRRALTLLDVQLPPPTPPTRPQLVSPPQPVLPPPVYIPPEPVKPERGSSLSAHRKYAHDKVLHEGLERQEFLRQQKAARIQADYQRACDAASAKYEEDLARYNDELRAFETYSRSREQALAAAKLTATAAGTPAESEAWRSLSQVLARLALHPSLGPVESAVATELSKQAAAEAQLTPQPAVTPSVPGNPEE